MMASLVIWGLIEVDGSWISMRWASVDVAIDVGGGGISTRGSISMNSEGNVCYSDDNESRLMRRWRWWRINC